MISGILEDREKRYIEILSLINKYNAPVICGKINYPGNDKNTPEAQKAFEILKKLLENKINGKSMHKQILSGEDGSSMLFAINLGPLEVKKTTVELEVAHPLGRIFDIDVYAGEGESIGRENLGIKSRKCIICEEDARICIRAGKHSSQEIVDKVNQLINEYMSLEANKQR